MSSKTPIRTVFNDSGVATGLAEFQTGEFIPLSHGGIGAALSIGSAGQVLKVNTGGSALEFGFVEAIVNIDKPVKLSFNSPYKSNSKSIKFFDFKSSSLLMIV